MQGPNDGTLQPEKAKDKFPTTINTGRRKMDSTTHPLSTR